MNESQFDLAYSNYSILFREWLADLPELAENGPILESFFEYTLNTPGKLFRPVLALSIGDMLGIDVQRLKGIALFLETMHVFTLIHDDLPALDNDTLRRGHATAHIKFGEDIAILGGDALSALAFRLLVEHSDKNDIASTPEIISLCAKAVVEVCEGQVLDVINEEHHIEELKSYYGTSLEDVTRKKKTTSLIQAAAQAPCLLLGEKGVKGNCAEMLSFYASSLGEVFQLTDDILDEVGEQSQIGKDIHSDRSKGKKNLTQQSGVETARQLAQKHCELAIEALDGFGEKADFLRDIPKYLLNRTK